MRLDDVREAIKAISYKPGSTIELAPVQGRLFDKEAGSLRIVVRLNLVDAISPDLVVLKTHTKEIPPAIHIRDRNHLMELVRSAIRDAECYENDQWLGIGGQFLFRKTDRNVQTAQVDTAKISRD